MQDKAKAYSRQKQRLAIVQIILSPVILISFIIMELPTYLKNISLLVSGSVYINLIVFSVLIGLAYYLVRLPLVYYAEFVLEHKFSLSNQAFKDWVNREIKKNIVSFVISIPLILCLYVFIRHWPFQWWLFTALLWFSISILVARLAPSLIVPLFYKYSPIKNTGLKDKLIRLSSKAGFKPEGVYEINMSKDTKKANAALIGLGSKKRIVLCDTLLENFTDPEIESVMGHELGHHKLRHALKIVLFGGVATILVLFITNIIFLRFYDILGYARLYDFESLVLIYAIISALNILVLPIHNAFSRKLEQQADVFALEITDNKSAFVSTMKRLAEQNLADTNPGKFYEVILYDHPPISRRIAFAESFKRKDQGIP